MHCFDPSIPSPPSVFSHSGLDCLQEQDGLFVLAGSLAEFSLLDQRIAFHVEERYRLQLLIFLHHPRLSVVGHGVSHLEAARGKRRTRLMKYVRR